MEVADVYATANDLPQLPHEIPLDDLPLPDEEFTEADVLPFLLQAQDIIAKLELRVVELETNLSSIHRKYEHDRHEWLVGLSQKDQYIHHLSSKLQKLEFNSNQAIVLLNGCYQGEIPPTDIITTMALCLNYLKNNVNHTNKKTNSNTNNNNHLNPIEDLEEGELERRQAATKEWKQNKKNHLTPSLSSTIKSNHKDDNMDKEENNENPNAWQPVNLMDGVDSSSISHENSLVGSDSPHVDSEINVTTTPASSMSRVTSDDGLSLLPTMNTNVTTQSSSKHEDDHDDHENQQQNESIISTSSTTTSLDHHCINCQQLLNQLDQQIEQKAYLKRDISALASQLSEEEIAREQLEIAQQDLMDDIEDITSSLFNSLNQILMDDVTDHEVILKLNREFDGRLAHIIQSWDTRESRLKQMKEYLIELDASLHQSSTTLTHHRPYSSIHSNNNNDNNTMNDNEWTNITKSLYQHHRHSRSISSTTGLDETAISQHVSSTTFDKSAVRLDGVNFNEFQSHLKILSSNIKSSSSTKTIQLSTTSFMKRIIAEDIEPCLFQNNGTSWWKSPWFKRKLMDAIANQRCEIQHAVRPNHYTTTTNTTTTNTTLSSSSASSVTSSPSIASSYLQDSNMPTPPKTKCTCCGLLRVCEFKMRLHQTNNNNNNNNNNKQTYQQQQQQNQQQPWLPIDRFCRDRLVAVCDFYGFLSQLPQAVTQNTPILVMFRQSLHFRRKMALAKVGSIGLFNNSHQQQYYYDSNGNLLMDSKRSPTSQRHSGSIRRRSRSSKRESIVLDHSGNASDTGSVVSLSDIQGLDGTSQIVIVH
ncbi:unnamed protein product [Cunninghamella blakesleeana]